VSGFETDRANRKAAWCLFEGRLAQAKADLADDALAIADEALVVAKDNKGLVAATIAALLAWAFRGPLIALATTRMSRQSAVQPDPANDDHDEYPEEQAP